MVAESRDIQTAAPGSLQYGVIRRHLYRRPIEINLHLFVGRGTDLVSKFFGRHDAYSLLTASNWQTS